MRAMIAYLCGVVTGVALVFAWLYRAQIQDGIDRLRDRIHRP